MPQLEFSTYASQIFWLALIFTILYLYLSRKTLPVIMEVLYDRQLRISSDLKKAESLKAEAEAAEVDFTSALSNARIIASNAISEAKAKIAAEEAVRNAKIEKNFALQNKEAEQRVANLRKEAAITLVPVSAAAAVLITKKLTGTEVALENAKNIALQINELK